MSYPDPGFCYRSKQLIAICNKTQNITRRNRLFPTFFGSGRVFRGDTLMVSHVTDTKVYAAPFSAKCAPGKVMSFDKIERELKEFEPSHIHLKNDLEPCVVDDPALKIRDDGTFEDDEGARWRMAQEKMAMHQRDSILERMFLMQRDALLTGQVVIEGDDFKKSVVDFGRPADHTIDLTADGGLGVCDPCFDFFGWLEDITMKMLAYGANGPFDIIMDKVASKALAAHPQFRHWYEKCCNNYMPPMEGTLANRAPEVYANTKLFARSAEYRFWTNCETFCDPDNGYKDTPVMPEGSILIMDAEAANLQSWYGAVRRIRRGTGNFSVLQDIQATPIYPRIRIDEECDKAVMHSHSNPLPVVGCPGATAFAIIATKECVDELCACPPLGMKAAEEVAEPEAAVKTPTATLTSGTAKKTAEKKSDS